MKYLVFFIYTMLITLPVSSAQRLKRSAPKFVGLIHKSPDKINFSVDSVYIRWYKPYFVAKTNADGEKLLVPDQQGAFNFTLPQEDQPYALQMFFFKNGRYKEIINSFFIVEQFDDIKLDISNNGKDFSVKFSGKGAEKYNLALALYDMGQTEGNRINNIFYNGNDLPSRLEMVNQSTKAYSQKVNRLINISGLSSTMKRLILYECSFTFFNWYTNFYSWYNQSKDLKSQIIIRDSFNKYKYQFSYEADTLMSLCPGYLQTIGLQSAIDLAVNSTTGNVKLESLFYVLEKQYPSKIRDILLTNLLYSDIGVIQEISNENTKSISDSLLKVAESIVESPFLKDLLLKKSRLSKGSKVPNATFTDINGREVTIESLKGKVILVDIWNLGCTACVMFHDWFHKNLYPSLEKNKDFIYLSVNGDRTAERWKIALKSGKYTSEEYMNVNLGGLSTKHTFSQFYRINAFPFIMIIDKDGNVYSDSVPQNKSLATKLINNALNENPSIPNVSFK